jgi:hypothetical protein
MGVVARWKVLDQEDSFVLQKISISPSLSSSLASSLSFAFFTRYRQETRSQIDSGTFVSDEQVFAAAMDKQSRNE